MDPYNDIMGISMIYFIRLCNELELTFKELKSVSLYPIITSCIIIAFKWTNDIPYDMKSTVDIINKIRKRYNLDMTDVDMVAAEEIEFLTIIKWNVHVEQLDLSDYYDNMEAPLQSLCKFV